jgi:hypothetical protein
MHCFHFLTVVTWLLSLLVGTLCTCIGSEDRLAFKQKQIVGDGPSNASAYEDMTYCYAPEASRTQMSTSYRVHRDEFVEFPTAKMSRTSPFLPSAP